jgi:hypothetical protein
MVDVEAHDNRIGLVIGRLAEAREARRDDGLPVTLVALGGRVEHELRARPIMLRLEHLLRGPITPPPLPVMTRPSRSRCSMR